MQPGSLSFPFSPVFSLLSSSALCQPPFHPGCLLSWRSSSLPYCSIPSPTLCSVCFCLSCHLSGDTLYQPPFQLASTPHHCLFVVCLSVSLCVCSFALCRSASQSAQIHSTCLISGSCGLSFRSSWSAGFSIFVLLCLFIFFCPLSLLSHSQVMLCISLPFSPDPLLLISEDSLVCVVCLSRCVCLWL